MRLIGFLLLGVFYSFPSWGDTSCWENHLVMDYRDQWNFQEAGSFDAALLSQNSSGYFPTAAASHFQWQENLVSLFFDFKSSQLSLPYNIYRLEVHIGSGSDAFLYEQDFTENCSGPGVSLFPGGAIHLPPFKIPSRTNETSQEIETVHIRIWGHL